jgi:hypothetical protein
MSPHILAFQALLFICGTVAFLGSLQFVRRLLELRQERTPPSIPAAELQERLERIEMTVEATAIEVERISEANRFMAKLLADRSASAPSGGPERVITPH